MIIKLDLQERNVILYGYKNYAGSSFVGINYVCDTSLHGSIEICGKHTPIITVNRMLSDKKAFVLIGLVEPKHREQAEALLKANNIPFDYLENYTVKASMVYLEYIVNRSIVCYRDIWNNKFVYAGNKPYKLAINLQPFSLDRRLAGNRVYIGKNFECAIPQNTYLRLRSSNNTVFIADNVKIISAEIIVSGAQTVTIGEETLIARNTIFRCEISHLLFDAKTKHALPQKKDIFVGKHVWLGEECYLLSGAKIGNGAVMGARSLTSSTKI